MSKPQVCLIFPPNEGLLGGTGYIHDEKGKVVAAPIFPGLLSSKVIDKKGIRFKRASVPLGILYAAAELRQNRFDVHIVDFQTIGYSDKLLLESVAGCDIVGFSTISGSETAVFEMCCLLRRQTDAKIIIGGPDCTMRPELYASNNTDAIFRGEAEGSLSELCHRLIAGQDISNIPGVVYRSKSGEFIYGPDKIICKDIDSFPLPARDLVDMVTYSFFGKRYAGKVASIITSRGCPYGCRFCARASLLCNTYRERSVEAVLDEIESLYRGGCLILSIVDSNFVVNTARARRILRGIRERGIKLMITVSMSVHNASPELFEEMYQTGVIAISLGLESGNDNTLGYFNKRTTRQMNENAVRWAHKAGIFIKATFILGAPDETLDEVMETIRFSRRIPIDVAHYCIMTYIYGSPMWDEAHAAGKIKDYEQSVYATRDRGLGKLSLSELTMAYQIANRHFVLRSVWRICRKIIRRKNWPIIPLTINGLWSILRDSQLRN